VATSPNRRRRRALPLALAILAVAPAIASGAPRGALAVARAGEDWRAEFDAICARTQDAMALSPDELRRLVERADALLPRLEALAEPERKVFTRRLEACRKLYAFVLEAKEKR
jgi:hypothetical protein